MPATLPMTTPQTSGAPLLTPRQLQVLELMAKGLTNREIAGVLGIAPGTAKVHVSAVLEALDVTNRTEAAVALRELGLEEDDADAAQEPRGDDAVPGFGGRPALAVLPFDPMGAGTDPALADGLVEDLITRLAAWRWFPVIARNSTFTYRGQAVDVARVAREMGARYVVEGSVRQSGDRLRVTVQLLDGSTGHHVFAERFDRRMEDVFDVQDEIVDAVLGALAPALLRVEGMRALRKPAANLSAWDAFQRGVTLLRLQDPGQADEARTFLDAAVAADPDFAAAHGELAFAHVAAALYAVGATQGAPVGGAGMQEALARAAQHAERAARAAGRAVAADPHDATAQLAAAAVAAMQQRVDDAEAALLRALERDPSSATGSWMLGNVRLGRGAADGAMPLYRRALRLSPRDPLLHHFQGALAAACLAAGRDAEALEAARESVAAQPAQGISYEPLVVAALVRLGRTDEAREVAARLRALRPDFNLGLARQIAPGPLVEAIREALADAGWAVPG